MPRHRLLLLALTCVAALGLAACGSEADTGRVPQTDTGATARARYASFHQPDPERIPSQLATNPGRPWGDYTGSFACKRCHGEAYRRWRGSFHSRTLYDATEDTVFGDFSGATYFDDERYDWIVRPSSRVDADTGKRRFFLHVRLKSTAEGGSGDPGKADTYRAGELPALDPPEFEVIYAFGNRRHQPYVVRARDGKHWVAPVYWNDAEEAWDYDGWRPYVRSCASCHATGIRTSDEPWRPGQPAIPFTQPTRYNLEPAREQWAEGAVGCEVCHGPGLAHIRAVEEMGVEEYRARLAAGTKDATIYDGRRESLDRQMDHCGQCHNFNTESTCTWVPTPEGFERDPLYVPIQPDPAAGVHQDHAGGMQFYPDGSHMSPCTAIAVYKTSKMYRKGIGCGSCHDPHGTDDWADLLLPVRNNALCLACHEDLQAPEAQAAHSHHAADSPGNLCVECHMPRVLAFSNGISMMGDRLHSHSFDSPTGVRRPGGPPSACNLCHHDRDHAWTRATLAAWKAEEAREAATGKAEDGKAGDGG